MKRSLLFLFGIFLLGAGGSWLWYGDTELREAVLSYVENREMYTLEPRYTPEQIRQFYQAQELLSIGSEPALKYFPYLLLDVKYAEEGMTKEGTILWSLYDGEMVLNTETWETTHGFEDCIQARASRNDFLLLQTLAQYPHGRASLDQLKKDLRFETGLFNQSVARALQKHLIVQLGPTLQLHFENPRIFVSPQTKFPSTFVTKPYAYQQQISKRFSHKKIEKVAKAAFGDHFAIRHQSEVYVPVYVIEKPGKDGSVHTSFWNAYNGQRFAAKPIR